MQIRSSRSAFVGTAGIRAGQTGETFREGFQALMNSSSLRGAIRRLPIPVLWERLRLPGRVSGHCVVRRPSRDDDRPFSIFANGTPAA
jgi:hypothetical protein